MKCTSIAVEMEVSRTAVFRLFDVKIGKKGRIAFIEGEGGEIKRGVYEWKGSGDENAGEGEGRLEAEGQVVGAVY